MFDPVQASIASVLASSRSHNDGLDVCCAPTEGRQRQSSRCHFKATGSIQWQARQLAPFIPPGPLSLTPGNLFLCCRLISLGGAPFASNPVRNAYRSVLLSNPSRPRSNESIHRAASGTFQRRTERLKTRKHFLFGGEGRSEKKKKTFHPIIFTTRF